jgi:hypothetical protein
VLSGITVPARLRKKFEALAPKFKRGLVEPIDAFEVTNREIGNRWIELRHTGANEGRGVVDWIGIQTARFRGANDPALQALEFVKFHGGLSDDQMASLEQRFPITTLDRLIRTPGVRELVGLNLDGKSLQTTIPASQVLKPLTACGGSNSTSDTAFCSRIAVHEINHLQSPSSTLLLISDLHHGLLKKIVLDLATKAINVSALKSRQQQVEYVAAFEDENRADLSEQVDAKPLSGIEESDFKVPRKKRRSSQSSERSTVAPKSLRLSISDDRIQKIFWELQHLKVEDFANAAAVLMRVFLELSVDHFLTKNHIPLEETTKSGHVVDKSLNAKVKEAIAEIVKSGGKPKDFISVTTGIDKASSPLYTGLLNAYVHNRYLTPKGSELVTTWSDAQPFFEWMWK